MIKVKGSFQGKPTSVLFNDGMLFAPDLFQAALDDLMTESEVVLSSAAPIVPDYSDEPSMAMLIESLFDSIDSTTSGLGAWWVDVAPSPIDLSKHAGPGNHPSGSPQTAHAGGNLSGVKVFPFLDPETGEFHQVATTRNKPNKNKDLTLCGKSCKDMKRSAPFEPGDPRGMVHFDRGCEKCRDILSNLENLEFRPEDYRTNVTRRPNILSLPDDGEIEVRFMGRPVGSAKFRRYKGGHWEILEESYKDPRHEEYARQILREKLDDPIAKHAVHDQKGHGNWARGLTTKEWEGRRGDPSHLTRKDTGTIPTRVIASLPGKKGEAPGEHRNRQGSRWEAFKADIAQRGIVNPIFIVVDPEEGPLIYEGNHRRDAALELGLEEVPVEIRYFGQAEWDARLVTARELGLADDRGGMLAGWIDLDEEVPAFELRELAEAAAEQHGLDDPDNPNRLTEDMEAIERAFTKHYGTGPHPGTGTRQDVHGHGAPFLPVGTGETVNRDVILDANGNPAPLGMEHLPPEVQADVLKTVGLYGQTFEGLRANIDTVFESAATRYEQMNSDRAWHPEDEYPEWLRDREYDGFREQLTEQGKDGRWRWVEDAGSHLRDLDRFYASHHEDLFDLAEIHDEPFGEVVAHHAAVSPGLRANENMRMTELAVQYWAEDFKFSPEQAEYINGHIQTDREKILGKGGWRAERIAPQLEFEVEAGMSYREVMKAAQPEAMARIMYRTQLFEGESLSLGRGYSQHAKGLNILYNDLDVDQHLTGPKVRSFYNNIIDPYAERDDITVDFQTTDAAWGGRGSNETVETDFTTTPRYKGVGLGVRPAVATAVRQSGASFSDRIEFENAAEMQEVLWAEWKRGTPTGGRGRSKRYGEGKWGIEWIEKVS